VGSFQEETWYKVTIGYMIDQSVVRIAYWINDTFEGWYEYSAFSDEGDLTYLSLQAAEGSVWFDDVNVSPWVTGVGEQHQTRGARNFTSVEPNPFNPVCTIRYEIPLLPLRGGQVCSDKQGGWPSAGPFCFVMAFRQRLRERRPVQQ